MCVLSHSTRPPAWGAKQQGARGWVGVPLASHWRHDRHRRPTLSCWRCELGCAQAFGRRWHDERSAFVLLYVLFDVPSVRRGTPSVGDVLRWSGRRGETETRVPPTHAVARKRAVGRSTVRCTENYLILSYQCCALPCALGSAVGVSLDSTIVASR